ncbi:MAG TPA: hypothetical protein VG317_21620 [Pseudonocardiaceae bacterium]|jgi:hypothetical protein|nr:hypothetical protein [Pseudonocardiaceae bacterium]
MGDDARESGGVYRVVFLKDSWMRRGFRYWWRRFWASVLYLFCLAIAGLFAFGFGTGISHIHQPVLRIVFLVIYGLTVVPGVVVGWNSIGAEGFPAKNSPSAPGYNSGCLAFIIAPFTTGLCLAVFAKTLLPQFPGEKAAREIYDDYRSGKDPLSPYHHRSVHD